jgi:hypothetical protein
VVGAIFQVSSTVVKECNEVALGIVTPAQAPFSNKISVEEGSDT